MVILKPTLSVLLVASLAGCGAAVADKDTRVFGVQPLVTSRAFEHLDLPTIVHPGPGAYGAPQAAAPGPVTAGSAAATAPLLGEGDPVRLEAERLEGALRDFYLSKDNQVQRRNRVQERLLAASAQRCAAYKQFVKQQDSEMGFGLAAIATALAGAGAIVSGFATQALAGSAAVVSGVNAEYQEKFFSRLAIQVITKGIDTRRERLYEAMLKRQREDLTVYPVEAAIKDALEYHGACSLVVGLEEAAMAIDRVNNLGLDEVNKLFAPTNVLGRVFLGQPERLAAAGRDLGPLAGATETLRTDVAVLGAELTQLPEVLTAAAKAEADQVIAVRSDGEKGVGDADALRRQITTAIDALGQAKTSEAYHAASATLHGLQDKAVALTGTLKTQQDAVRRALQVARALNARPRVTTLTPDTLPLATAATVTVTGANFGQGATVSVDGTTMATTVTGAGQLRFTVPATAFAAAGARGVSVRVGMVDAINVAPLSVVNPAPTLSDVSPRTLTRGVPADLTLMGSGFVAGATVRIAEAERQPTTVSGTRIIVRPALEDVEKPGAIPLAVSNPLPGGGLASPGLTVSVENPSPSVTAVAPREVAVGAGGLSLTVTGSGFVPESTALWNGAERRTRFVSATELAIEVPAADLAVAGAAVVTVQSPGPGGGRSSGATVTVKP
jgi:hypothetical protein